MNGPRAGDGGSAARHVLRIRASADELARVRAFVRDVAAREGAEAAAIADVVQAVDESVTNAIVHGYAGREGTVDVEVERDGSRLVVRLRDQAPRFDPTLVPPPDVTLPLELRPPGGMGVFLTRELMDDVRYRHSDDCNELTLVKDCIR